MKPKNKKGFTIVELVIVIAVIGVLAAILIPTFINLNNKAKVANTTSFLKNVNTQLAAKEANHEIDDFAGVEYDANGRFLSYFYAKEYAKQKLGYDFDLISPFDGNEICWDENNKKLGLINYSDEANPIEVYADVKIEEHKWQRLSNDPVQTKGILQRGDSLAFKDDFSEEELTALGSEYYDPATKTLKVSGTVELGNNPNIKGIEYNNTGDAKDVLFSTNSASVGLTINDETTGSINHYGNAGPLNIIRCHTGSYHENGKVAYAEISYGRIVLESGSKIEEIHINKKENEQAFDTVIIANNGGEEELPERITRDAVTVENETLVVKVESNGTSENVYVYADTDTGEKGTTQKITEGENRQNENVNSSLGQLVLDNGATGEKAQTIEQKEAAKEEIVQEAKYEEAQEKGNIIHVDEVPATCTENGMQAYDYYMDGETKVIVGGLSESELIIPAGHTKAASPVYQNNFNGRWQHATQCAVCGNWIVEYCVDEDEDNACDLCGHQMAIEVSTFADLCTDVRNGNYVGILSGYYKLTTDVALEKPYYGNVYLSQYVTIDLNGHTLSNYPLNGPTDAQFRSFGTANATYVFTLKDSSDAKTGKFISRFGDHFLYGGQNNGNNKLIINCEDGVTINTSYDYQGNEMNSFAYTAGYFVHNVSKDIEIRNAHLVIGGIAMVNSGYTVTFKNCTIDSRQSSGDLQSGSGDIVYDGCTITTVKNSSSGNVLDSSSPNVTYLNGTTVNGVVK